VAAVTTGAIAKAVSDFAGKSDEIAKTARMLGMGAEALQELRYASDIQGVGSEQLTQGFKLLNKNVGDLKAGTGSLYAQLKRTNPQLARQLGTTQSSEQAFMLLVDALDKEKDTAKRAALAQAAFGKSGQELIKVAEAGTEGIMALRKEARRFGLVSKEDAKIAEDFQDSMTRLKMVFMGVANNLLPKLLKLLDPLIKRFTEWVVANRELIGQKVAGIFKSIGNVIRTIGPYVKEFFNVLSWAKDKGILKWAALGIGNVIRTIGPYVKEFFNVLSWAKDKGILKWAALGIGALITAQWAWNVALSANPIGAVIMGLVALIAIIVIVKKHWKEITEAVRNSWNWFNRLFENPWIKIALYTLASPLALIASFIQTIVDLLSGKGWKSFMNLLGPYKMISDALGLTKKGSGRWNAKASTDFSDAGTRGAASPMASAMAAQGQIGRTMKEVQESRATVDVNFNNTPAGTAIKQKGVAPGFTLNTGFNLSEARW